MKFSDVLARYLGKQEITRENGRKLMETFNLHLAQNFYRGTSLPELADDRCCFIDCLLCKLYNQFQLYSFPEIAIIAVGGYGRKELHPFTDIDILILTETELDSDASEKVSALITLLWDLKLDVGHAVRTVSQCVSAGMEDLTIATNLLEIRLICGSEETYHQLEIATDPKKFWPIKQFFRAKMEEQANRHKMYKNTMYRLEPDLKNMCGGLRDVQTIMWIARKFSNAKKPDDILKQGFITESEYHELFFNAHFIWKVRFALQFVSKRNDNRLTFDRQVAVAKMLGYIGEGNIPVENLMIRFYLSAQSIEEINQMLLKMYEEAIFKDEQHCEIRVINSKFILRGTMIDVVDHSLFMSEPSSIMEMMSVISAISSSGESRITGIYPKCLRSIKEARRRLSVKLIDIPKCRHYFLKILSNINGMLLPLKLMIRHGIMTMYMSEWMRLTGLMQFDMFHTYTVDEHTYRTISNIYEFSHTAEIDPSRNLFREIYANLPKQHLLYFAALLHDIGKGRPGGHHAQIGAEISSRFLTKHELPQSEVRLLTWLVEHHIDFSNTAQRRDISDPNVISDFATTVQDETHLDYLYCLSIADICATNDTAWNSWKDALFRELYYATQRALRRDPSHPSEWDLIVEENKRETMRLLTADGIDCSLISKLWDTFSESYFIRHNKAQIYHHTKHILSYDKSGDLPLIIFGESVNRLGTEIFVYMKDRLGIFAKIVKILLAKQISIMNASILGSTDGFIMDSFTVTTRDGTPIPPEKMGPLRKFMMISLINDIFTAPSGISMPKKYLQFKIKTAVTYLDIPGSEEMGVTHMEVSALDRPGLLASIATAIEELGINIHAARIATTGERADDGFTISLHSRSLNSSEKEQLRERVIRSIDGDCKETGQSR